MQKAAEERPWIKEGDPDPKGSEDTARLVAGER